ncbi:MAG: hypothetical protein DRJ98_03255 [Thermoprotei archaeon]|nr:MAG: hypothetical protein DRJ98_03255 [Thermoprotei archaeon]
MLRTLNVMVAASRRYFKLDLKYRFELTVNAALLIANIVSFGLLGNFVVSSNPELVSYPYHVFLLTGIYYWTAIATGFNTGIFTLHEEMERGTIGFLLSNGVSPAVITLSRMAVSTIEAIGISTIIAVPAILISSGGSYPVLPLSQSWFVELVASISLPWLFMASVAVALTAVQLVFKRIGGLAGAIHYALGVASGLYFPPQAIPLVGWFLEKLPISIGLATFRELLVFGEARSIELTISRITTPLTPEWILVFTPLVLFALSLVLLVKVERITMRWGTIEQY